MPFSVPPPPQQPLSDATAQGLDEPAILGLIDAVIYDWNLATDVIAWGANVRHVLKGLPEPALAGGAAFAACEADGPPGGRAAALFASGLKDAGQGAPYQIRYALAGTDGARLEIIDFGRWFADAAGRPLRAHGLLRVLRAETAALPAAAPPIRLAGPLSRAELTAAILAKSAEPASPKSRYAVVAIGIDDLERFNALRGFLEGDELLEALSQRIARMLRSSDAFARHAGAKFLALLSMGPKDTGETVAKKLADRFNAEPFALADGATAETVRIGLALGGRSARGAEALIQRADDALEGARASGALSACFDEAESRSAALRSESAELNRLDAALAGGCLQLAYQPLAPLKPGLPTIHEALARFQDERGALTAPGAWLALAERRGRIAKIDQAVLDLAIAKLIARPDVTIGVNVSPLTLRDPAFAARLAAVLHGRPTLARRLVIEIVETPAIHDAEAVAARFAELRVAGVRLAMDDFGAGHTSLRNLRALKVDIVKIDGAFVQNVARSSDDRFFVREVIALARRIGAKIVAEWVEDAETLALLRKWGCDYAQGKYLGEPSPEIAFEEAAAAGVA